MVIHQCYSACGPRRVRHADMHTPWHARLVCMLHQCCPLSYITAAFAFASCHFTCLSHCTRSIQLPDLFLLLICPMHNVDAANRLCYARVWQIHSCLPRCMLRHPPCPLKCMVATVRHGMAWHEAVAMAVAMAVAVVPACFHLKLHACMQHAACPCAP